MKNKIIKVNDLMQKNYSYELIEEEGKNLDENFKPELTPKEMLELGVFGGVYMRDCKKEFHIQNSEKRWFEGRHLKIPTRCKHCRENRKNNQ
jgi:hypothetical protein